MYLPFEVLTGVVNAGVAINLATLLPNLPELASLVFVLRKDVGQYTSGADILPVVQTIVTAAPGGANEIQLSAARTIILNDACVTSTVLQITAVPVGGRVLAATV